MANFKSSATESIREGILRLILLGDISIGEAFSTFGEFAPALADADCVVANLEGAIISQKKLSYVSRRKALVLVNSPEVLKVLEHFNVKAVCLANNHVYDVCRPVQHTVDVLARAEVASFGAGANLAEASEPFVFQHDDTTLKVFSFGWEVIGSLPASDVSEGVNPFVARWALDTIRSLRGTDDSSFVVFIMHWNYELELYPQPAHRQLAHDLIREGVDAIVGLHPHVAQGAEFVEGRPIVYSLGDWFFPPRQLGYFRLAYPPITSRQLALELDIRGRRVMNVRFHWHWFDADVSLLSIEKTEDSNGSVIQELTPYSGMGHSEYVHWFRRHRRRRRGLPVYVDYRHSRRNWTKDQYVKLRQSLIQTLVRARFKRGPRA